MFRALKISRPYLAGAAVGAIVGYHGQCQSGACLFTATWWGGAVSGVVVAAVATGAGRAGT